MNSKFHGVTSLLLEGLAIGIGFAAIWASNQTAGVVYGIVVLAALLFVVSKGATLKCRAAST